MPDLDELTARVRATAEKSDGLSRPVLLDLGDTGLIHLEGTTVGNEEGPADCRISLSADNLERLMEGRLNATMAYMTGQLKVQGDMTLALQLASALRAE